MAAESRDTSIFFFEHFIPRWPQRFSYWSHAAFYICNYDVITKASMTSLKNHTHSSWGVLALCQVSIFSLVWFRRYRGPKFFRFSNMAATPCDLCRDNYHYNILHFQQWWKFRLNQTSACWEKCKISVRTNKQTNTDPNGIPSPSVRVIKRYFLQVYIVSFPGLLIAHWQS